MSEYLMWEMKTFLWGFWKYDIFNLMMVWGECERQRLMLNIGALLLKIKARLPQRDFNMMINQSESDMFTATYIITPHLA